MCAFKTDCQHCLQIEESFRVHSHHQALLNDDKKFMIVPGLSYQKQSCSYKNLAELNCGLFPLKMTALKHFSNWGGVQWHDRSRACCSFSTFTLQSLTIIILYIFFRSYMKGGEICRCHKIYYHYITNIIERTISAKNPLFNCDYLFSIFSILIIENIKSEPL